MLSIRHSQVSKGTGEPIGPAPWIEASPPGPLARGVIARTRDASLPSYQPVLPLVVRRARGSILEDVDGNRFLDFSAGAMACASGHSHPRVVEAIASQAQNLIFLCPYSCYHPNVLELMHCLQQRAPQTASWRVYLKLNASDALGEAAQIAMNATGRRRGLALYGRSASGQASGRRVCSNAHMRGLDKLGSRVAFGSTGDFDALKMRFDSIRMNPGDLACIIVEALPADSGLPTEYGRYLANVRSFCDEHSILMVVDEIETCMGKTGRFFALDHFDVTPDLIVMGRGLAGGMPIGAVLVRSPIADRVAASDDHGFLGSPIACAAALASIDVVESNMMEHAVPRGALLREKLEEVRAKRSCLADVRGAGILSAVDVVSKKSFKRDPRKRDRIVEESFRRGLILMGANSSTIRFSPALCINETQIEVAMQLFDEAIATVI